jgi:hypothetical protein
VLNILSLSSGQLKNFVSAVSTGTVTLVQTTTTSVVVKVSSLLLCNGSPNLATATVQIVSDTTTHPVAVGINVDPEQTPVALVTRSAPLYLTGSQSLRANASNTNVAVLVNYEELS